MSPAAPYVGLAPFGEADADRFFGRDAERRRIIANLQASRFTLLYARSGVGKSSLLRAGVVARLAAGSGSRLVPFIFSSWRGDPNVELPRALGPGGDGLEQALERRAGESDGTLLVILDQFEEFFQYHQGTPAGERFADDLARCVQRADLRAHFLVSIRDDAYSRLGDEFKGRLPNVYSNYLHLDDLDERGARAAIEEPLRRNGNGHATIEPGLVDQVLSDVRRDEGANGHARYEAAHLQYVLRRLWDEEAKRGSDALRLATLQELGGSEAIFERHFDEALEGLGSAERDALAQAFRFLVTSTGTKRAESAADLADLTGVPLPTLERALEHLREARVLTPVAAGDQTRYELAHDLLAEPALEWRREREKAHELRRLRRIVAGLGLVVALLGGLIVWALLERAAAGRQADRAHSQALVADSASELSDDPAQSVALAGDAWRVSNTPEAEAALRRALAASSVRGRLDVGPAWSGTLSQNGDVAVTERRDGVAVWRGLQARAPVARVPGGGGAAMSADGGVVAAMTGPDVVIARTGAGGGSTRIANAKWPAVSADGRYVAARRGERMIVVDASTGQVLARRATRLPVLAFDPSHDRTLVAGDCLGRQIIVWSWKGDGRARTVSAAPIPNHTRIPRSGDPACRLVVSPDGTRAAQSGATGWTSLWDLARDRRIARDLAAGETVFDMAWSPSGDRLAIAADKVATVLDRNGHEVSRTPSQLDLVHSVAFNRPAGDLLVTANRDHAARVWDTRSGALVTELRGHKDEVADAAFTADGRDVVTLSLDGTVRSWEVVAGPVIRQADWVLDAAFSRDGKRIATAAADGRALVTPLAGGRPMAIRGPVPLRRTNSVAFDPAGRQIAVAGGRDAGTAAIVVADAATGAARHEMLLPGQPVLSADFSPDGKWLVTTSVSAPPALWQLSEFGIGDRRPPTATLPLPPDVLADRAEFSPDGRSIVTAGSDGIGRVYDFRTRQTIRKLPTPGLMSGATYSRDGTRILTYGSDPDARVWDARTGRLLTRLHGHTSSVSRGAFSRDGDRVVTGSADKTTRVWDARNGKLLSTQQMHNDVVNSVAYSPDGKLIVSGSDDDTARVYACATCEPVQDLIQLARRRGG